ncbi:hypothetical protein EH223_04160 [candidate division KSB1 bacterium]|nr:Omp28-related outer membrane protein [candidate division KSB1 bacterium]RQW05677.1 MAG: hypothetical protein EH223_04160 [candidate division KSB1 bacterium]
MITMLRILTSLFVLIFLSLLIASETAYSPRAEFTQKNEPTVMELEHDVSVVNMIVPVAVKSGKMTLVQAVVQNNGLNTETCDVEFGYLEWDSTFVVKRTRTATDLPPGEQQPISFGFYTFTANVEYNYFVRVVLQEDMNPDNDVLTQAVNSFETNREVVLIEKATGTWCGYCPGAARCVTELQRAFPGQVAAIDYHISDNYENAQCRPRAEFYNVPGYPTAKFNGISEIVGGASAFAWEDLYRENYKPRFLAALGHGTCLDMQLTYMEKNNKITAHAALTGLATSYVKNYRIFYVVVESHIKQSWGGLDSLQHVFRGVYPDWNGVPFITDQPIEEGVTFESDIEFDFPANVVQENSEIIAFVQNIDNQAVTVAAIGEKVEPPPIPFEITVYDTTVTDTAGKEIVFAGLVHNLLDTELSIQFNRFINDIPETWTTAICLDLCLAPWVDQAEAQIPPNDSLEFSMHFFTEVGKTDSGYVCLQISDSAKSKIDSVAFKATAVAQPTGIATKSSPATFELVGNHPNPFNPQTIIEYAAGERCTSATLQVFSLLGQLVAEKPLLNITPGLHRTSFTANDLGAGVYVYRLLFETAEGSIVSEQKKFTLLK